MRWVVQGVEYEHGDASCRYEQGYDSSLCLGEHSCLNCQGETEEHADYSCYYRPLLGGLGSSYRLVVFATEPEGVDLRSLDYCHYAER